MITSTSQVTFNYKTRLMVINGSEMRRSVTGLVKSFFHEFDPLETANAQARERSPSPPKKRAIEKSPPRVQEKKSHPLPPSQVDQENISPEDIALAWQKEGEEASSLGRSLHQSIENFYKNGTRVNTLEFKMFIQFHNNISQLGYVPLASEKLVYDTDLSISGVVDMLYIRKSDIHSHPTKVWLIDWKRSKAIHTTGYGGRCGLPPLQDLQDCNFQHYSMQLNIYKYLLEKNYNFLVQMMSIIVLHPNQRTYAIHHVEPRQDLVLKMLLA